MKLGNLYKTIFVQVLIFILSILIFIIGYLMLADLKNYRYILTGDIGACKIRFLDKEGNACTKVDIHCGSELRYSGIHNLYAPKYGYKIDSSSGYTAESDGIYLDIYFDDYVLDELVFLETVHTNEYSKVFKDEDYYGYHRGDIKIIPRIENIKYKYPAWRIYVPVFLFILSLPIILLSGYIIIIKFIEITKIKKESEMPIAE